MYLSLAIYHYLFFQSIYLLMYLSFYLSFYLSVCVSLVASHLISASHMSIGSHGCGRWTWKIAQKWPRTIMASKWPLNFQAVTRLRLEMCPLITLECTQKSCLPEGGRKLPKIAKICKDPSFGLLYPTLTSAHGCWKWTRDNYRLDKKLDKGKWRTLAVIILHHVAGIY